MEPYRLGKRSSPARTGGDARLFVEAVLWIARTGAPCCDLPEEFGKDRRHDRQASPPRPRCKKGGSEPSHRSVGGMTGKIVALTDAPGNLVGFTLLPGQRHDTVGVAALIKGRRFGGLVADTAFAVNWIVDDLDGRQAGMVIAQRANRVVPRAIDRHIDQWRHPIENYFGKLKEFKRIAMRACKTDTSVAASRHACAAGINSR